ncbi:MAG TPA: ABC transporter permease [Candidatus Limnocylindrales bacterium]
MGVTVGGWLGVALRRAAYDAALLVAAALVVLVAAGTLVAAAIYPDTIVRSGITRTLAAADPATSAISVTIDVRSADVAEVDPTVRDVIGSALGPAADQVALTGSSEAYGFSSGAAEGAPATRFAFADGLEAHARLVRGRWPVGAGADLEATVTEPAAVALGVDTGSTLDVASKLDPSRRFSVRIVGVFALDDPADAFWGSDRLVLNGTEKLGSFTTIGPLFIGRVDLLGRTIVGRATLAWRAVPAFERFAPENLADIGSNVAGLTDRLAGRLGRGQAIVVRTDLPRLLDGIAKRITQADSGSTLVAGQIVVLAMYALILVAGLVVGQRRAATGLLRARGAGSRHLLGLAVIEAVLIAVPAAALGIPVGLGLATLLGAGPTATVGPPAVAVASVAAARLSGPVVVLAAVAALVAIVGLSVPTALSVGPLAGVHRSPGRQRAVALLQRSRIDVALAALGVFALWRLRGSGGQVVDQSVTPLAAAGPAIGLLAGAIVVLRIVPLIGRGLERALVREGGVAGALSVRSVARRSAAYGRPALLFAVSAAIALFAVGYARTWERSQRDQVAHAVGADIRGQVGPAAGTTDRQALATYRAISGVRDATPVAHEDFVLGTALPHGMLLGVVPDEMRSIAAFRPDLGTRPFADLMAGLLAARPDPPVVTLPAGTRRVRLRADLRLSPIGPAPNLPAGWTGLGLDLVIRDANGLLQRVPSTPAFGAAGDAFVVALGAPIAGQDPRPVAILAMELRLRLPGDQILAGTVGIRSIETSLTSAGGGDWTAVAADSTLATWGFTQSAFALPPTPVPSGPDTVDGDLIAATIAAGAAISGPGTTTLVARPTALSALVEAPLAGLVDPAILEATGASSGDVVLVRHASSVTRRIRTLSVVTAFPGLPGDGLAVVDLPTLQLVQFAADGTFPVPDEWWLSVADGTDRSVLTALSVSAAPLEGVRSTALETGARIDDPIALAISGMLVLAAAAAGAFAAIGFAAAAWASTNSRIAEFAVARALGLSRREIAGWLVLEQAYPALIGIGWGILLGAVLEWLVLPAVTLAPAGGLAVPPAVVDVPWDLVGWYAVIAVALIVGAAAVLLRSVERAGMAEPLRGES